MRRGARVEVVPRRADEPSTSCGRDRASPASARHRPRTSRPPARACSAGGSRSHMRYTRAGRSLSAPPSRSPPLEASVRPVAATGPGPRAPRREVLASRRAPTPGLRWSWKVCTVRCVEPRGSHDRWRRKPCRNHGHRSCRRMPRSEAASHRRAEPRPTPRRWTNHRCTVSWWSSTGCWPTGCCGTWTSRTACSTRPSPARRAR